MFCKRCRCPETPDPVDYGPNPLVIDLPNAAECNWNFRAALWTGEHLQVTLMCIPVGGDVGLELHPDVDQFLFVVDGCGVVKMGSEKDNPTFVKNVFPSDAIFIPAGTWHNLINTGGRPIKLSSAYAPPEHPHGTIQKTQAEAIAQGYASPASGAAEKKKPAAKAEAVAKASVSAEKTAVIQASGSSGKVTISKTGGAAGTAMVRTGNAAAAAGPQEGAAADTPAKMITTAQMDAPEADK